MVTVFDNDEEAYLDWVRANPRGFVANVDRQQQVAQYPMAHRATHKLMSSARIGNFTTGDYIKFCSTSLPALEKHARSKYGRALSHCATCMRGSAHPAGHD